MTSTIICEIATADGTACWRSHDRTEYQSTPPSSFDEWQPGRIPVNVAHRSRSIGTIDYLECLPDSFGGSLMAVGVVDAPAELVDGMQCSPELRANAMYCVEKVSYRLDRRVESYGTLEATHTILDAVGIVSRTAGVTAARIRAFDGDYRNAGDWLEIKAFRPPPILERAKEAAGYDLRYRRPHKLHIHRPPSREIEIRNNPEIHWSDPYPGVLAVRNA